MIAEAAVHVLGIAPNMDDSAGHRTVLLSEAIEGLSVRPDGIYVDGTFGRGGHSRALLSSLGPNGRLIAFDRDPAAVAVGRQLADARFEIVHAPFSRIASCLRDRGIDVIDGLLLDLGVSSPQLENPARGFSFLHDGPLDMRMDTTTGEPLSAWLAHADSQQLAEVIAQYGEERFAVPIADAIAARCAAADQGTAKPLDTTAELAGLVAQTLRRCRARKEPGQHPATRTFQALRIYINSELDELKEALASALELLRDGGRIAVISFHSLEDRIVKEFIRSHSEAARPRPVPGVSRGQQAMMQVLSECSPAPSAAKSALPIRLLPVARIRPSAREIADNPRARSAVLRIAQRTPSAVGRPM